MWLGAEMKAGKNHGAQGQSSLGEEGVADWRTIRDGFWEPEEHNLSPGKSWEAVGPSTLLGYNYYAPADNTAAPELIISSWLQNRSSIGDVEAWMVANKSFKKWNACTIQKGVKYVYFENLPFGIHVKREINKENW